VWLACMDNANSMGSVVHLNIKPKTLTGSKRNVRWTITYIPADRAWSWHVEVHTKPQVFSGTKPTLAEAKQEVEQYVQMMTE